MQKKILYIIGGIIVLLAIVFFIVGSGETPKGTVEDGEPKESISVYSMNEEVEVGNKKWKVLDVKDRGSVLKASNSDSAEEDLELEDGRFIEVDVKVENQGEEAFFLNSGEISLMGEEQLGTTPTPDAHNWISTEKSVFALNELEPGTPREFTAMYKAPSYLKDDELKLEIRDMETKEAEREKALVDLEL